MSVSSILEEPVLEVAPEQRERGPGDWYGWANAALLAIALSFYALHFVHLTADFPNHSGWMDWAKYTDEGWYGDAAIRHYQLGHWNVAGDFNPAAALPVWPAIEIVLFRFSGVSLVAARALTVAIFGLILLCSYMLLRRWPGFWNRVQEPEHGDTASIGPALAVLLLAISPFLFAFMRLAILEPFLILLTLAALLVASAAGKAQASGVSSRLANLGWAIALGALLTLMVLTKTTAVFLFPAIFWMLLGATGYKFRPFIRTAATGIVVGVVGWLAYYGLFVRPHYLIDYKYLFSANAYTGITLATAGQVLHDTVMDGAWIGRTMFGLALLSVAGAIYGLFLRRFRGNPLPGALLLWILGYAAFLAYHDNLQPRYYMVVAAPLTLLVAAAFDALLAGAVGAWHRAGRGLWLLRAAAVGAGVALTVTVAAGGYYTVYFVTHPQYSFVNAANQIRDAVEREHAADPKHSNLILSISGSDISLMTGLPSICDDFGVMDLPDRVAAYKPGWFASWNDVEDDKMEALAPMYKLVRVLSVPAFDDPERNQLILYRLDPLSAQGRGKPGRRHSLSAPRRLRTNVGEQPTIRQLEH